MAGTTRLELATSCVTGMRSNQTELRSLIPLSFVCRLDLLYYAEFFFAILLFNLFLLTSIKGLLFNINLPKNKKPSKFLVLKAFYLFASFINLHTMGQVF